MGGMTDRITQADIVGACLTLLAAGGLHALAMRGIASELGIQQSALYWHFDNKQQLLAAVADEIVSSVDLTEGGDWSTRVVVLASRLRGELLRFPDGAELVATTFAFRLGARQPFWQFTEELVRGGLPLSDAEIGASVLLYFVLGYATDEQQHQQAAALGAIEHGDDSEGAEVASGNRFERGLGLIVAGLDVQIRNASTKWHDASQRCTGAGNERIR